MATWYEPQKKPVIDQAEYAKSRLASQLTPSPTTATPTITPQTTTPMFRDIKNPIKPPNLPQVEYAKTKLADKQKSLPVEQKQEDPPTRKYLTENSRQQFTPPSMGLNVPMPAVNPDYFGTDATTEPMINTTKYAKMALGYTGLDKSPKIAGPVEGVAESVDELATGENLSLIAASVMNPAVGYGLGAYYIPQMAKGSYEYLKDANEQDQAGNEKEAWKGRTKGAILATMALMGIKHGGKGIIENAKGAKASFDIGRERAIARQEAAREMAPKLPRELSSDIVMNQESPGVYQMPDAATLKVRPKPEIPVTEKPPSVLFQGEPSIAETPGKAGPAEIPGIPAKEYPTYTPEQFRVDLESKFGLPKDQADAAAQLAEARANTWAKQNNKTPAEWFATRIASVEFGGKPGTLHQQENAPTFYSQLQKVIEEKMPNKASPDQIRGLIKGRVKEEEIQWSGLDDLLSQGKSMTKQEVLDHLKQNEIQVEEVMKGGENASMTKFQEHQLPGGEPGSYRELLLKLPERKSAIKSKLPNETDLQYQARSLIGEWESEANNFKSSHFNEPNILAHVRFNDRVGPNGEKILHLEEVQSDWHQKGRRKGYTSDPDFGKDVINDLFNGGVPDAPFKKTWQDLALKRMVRYAAENGYDKLTWTTGEQQAERYDLSKQISQVSKSGSNIEAWDLDGKTVIKQTGITDTDLPDLIGKEAAKKLLDAEPVNGVRTLSGLDLKIGGEGMKGFYDKILPDSMNKLGKKFGVKVGTTDIGNGVMTHSIDIPDALKQSVLEEGQALFQKGKGIKGSVQFLEDGKAIIKAFNNADVSTAVHELGHVFRRDLEGPDLATVEEWAGVKKGKWKREHEEKFAQGFEQYVKTGKAPTYDLALVFEKFKAWLSEIYAKLRGLKVKVSPEVSAVFDTMLGKEKLTPERIQELKSLSSEIASAEAGSRNFLDQDGQGGTKIVKGSESTFPVQDLGSKQEQIGIIEKALRGENLTASQHEKFAKMLEYLDEQERMYLELHPNAEITPPVKEASPINRPIPTDTNRKERGFVTTVKESPTTAPEVAEMVLGSYDVLPNTETMAEARAAISANPAVVEEEVLGDGVPTAKTGAAAQIMMIDAQKQGNFLKAVRIAEVMAKKLTNAGQFVQVASIWNRLSPEGVLVYAERIAKKARDQMAPGIDKDIADNSSMIGDKMDAINAEAVPAVETAIADELNRKITDLEKTIERLKRPKLASDYLIEAKKILGDPKNEKETLIMIDYSTSMESLDKERLALEEALREIDEPKILYQSEDVSGEKPKTREEILAKIEAIKLAQVKAFNKLQKDLARKAKVEKPLSVEKGPKTENVKRSAAQVIADKINVERNTKTPQVHPIRDMINTLHAIAKESLPKPEAKKLARDPIEFVGKAIENRGRYREAFEQAKEIVRHKYRDNPTALTSLNDLFGRELQAPAFAEKHLNQAVKNYLKENNINLAEIVRDHYLSPQSVRQNLTDFIVKKSGVSLGNARELSEFIQAKFNDMTASKKRAALDALFKENKKTPPKPIDRKIIEMSNLGAIDRAEYRPLVAEKLGLPVLTEELASKLTKAAQDIQGMPEGEEKVRATQLMMKEIANMVPVSMWRKIDTVQTIAQLLNFKTPIRNVIGNLGFMAIDNAAQALMAGIDTGVSKFTGKRTITLPDLLAQWEGLKKGLAAGAKDVSTGTDTSGLSTQMDLSIPGQTNASGMVQADTFKSKTGKFLEKALGYSLRVPDRGFSESAIAGDIANQKKLAKLNSVPFDENAAKEHALLLAKYRTFQDDSAWAHAFSGIKKYLNTGLRRNPETGRLEPYNRGFGVGSLVLKYPKTPANLLARGIDYSPVSFYRALSAAISPKLKGSTDIILKKNRSGTYEAPRFNQEEFVNNLGKGLTGSALIAVGYYLVHAGILTGKREDDKDMAQLLDEQGLGKYQLNWSALQRFLRTGKPQSIKKDDVSVSYDWMQPQAIGIAMGANIAQSDGDVAIDADKVAGSLKTSVDTLSEQPLVSGLTRAFKSRSLTEGAESVLQGTLSSFVPTILNQYRMFGDNSKIDTYDPNFFQRSARMAISRIPGAANLLPIKRTSWGEPAEIFQGGSNTAMNVFLNPAFVSHYQPDEDSQMVIDLFRSTGETKHAPSLINRKVRLGDFEAMPSAKVLGDMQQYAGQRYREAYASFRASPLFQNLPDDEKVNAISSQISKIGHETKIKFFGDKYLEKEEQLGDAHNVIKARQEVNEFKENEDAKSLWDSISAMTDDEKDAYMDSLSKKDPILAQKVTGVRADIVYKNILSLPKEDRRKAINGIPKEVMDRVERIYKKEMVAYGPKMFAGIKPRYVAEYLVNETKNLSKEEVYSKLKDMQDKKLINDDDVTWYILLTTGKVPDTYVDPNDESSGVFE